MAKRNRDPEGKHHKFCAYSYRNGITGGSWNCSCELLKAYDKWRKKK